MATCIANGCLPEAHEDFSRLMAIIAADHPDNLALRKLRCAQVLTHCTRGARQGGAPSGWLMDKHLETIELLNQQRSWTAVCRIAHELIDELARAAQKQRHTNIQRIVRWVRREMSRSLASPKPLYQYAQDVDISRVHLSRSFARIVGATYCEELRKLRMHKAKHLLLHTSLKIASIARQVGVRDPSQFVSDFRREVGITPGAYRYR